MYYVDMLKSGECSRGSNNALLRSQEGTVPGGIVLEGNMLIVGEGDNLFAAGLSGEASEQYLNSGLSYAAIADTEENPVVIVRCSKIELYKNQPVSIKFLYCGKDYMVAALIHGTCIFNGVPLQRCSSVNLNDLIVGRAVVPSDLSTLGASCTDKESGHNYIEDCVFQLNMLTKDDGKGNVSFKSSYVKVGERIFSTKRIEEAREKKRKAQEEAERKRKEREAFLEKQRLESVERQKRVAEEEAAKLEAKQAKKQLKISNAKPKEEKVICGAADFLSIVANLQKG